MTLLAEKIAASAQADVIKVDAQDIAEIAGYISVDAPEDQKQISPVRSLGYDVHIVDSDMESSSAEDGEAAEEGYEDGEEEDSSLSKTFPVISPSKPSKANPVFGKGGANVSPFLKSFKVLIPYATSTLSPNWGSPAAPLNVQGTNPIASVGKAVSDAVVGKEDPPELSQSQLIFEAFLDSPRIKRFAEQLYQKEADMPLRSQHTEALQAQDLVIIVQDYLELQTIPHGGAVLDRLHEVVRKRRKEGHRIVLVGVSTAEDMVPSMTKNGLRKLQIEPRQTPYRTVITTCLNEDVDSVFKEDDKMRVKRVNIRHLQDMLQRLSSKASQVANIISKRSSEVTFDSAQSYNWGLSDTVWSLDRVHRAATIAIGMLEPDEKMTVSHLSNALETIQGSDNSKMTWLDEENARQSPEQSPNAAWKAPEELKAEQEERMRRLRKTCTSHERKLLSGVIDPSKLHTTFSDVQAPTLTIEALKTLTSLSLIRPDAFTYGVLATDKIPGLLLYGPPGTGKTLLAKAVAKESGATVLEVSGSDIYDMYVGEGEKNVRALFSLARKLSPCVVFVDEADAIFGSRNTSGNRTSHRELINQFLREWDGMASSKSAAFIMVATNRPFDLDDAVLRRLPRRLMVDLPTKKDREAILKIHLRDESLSEDVSLEDLAERTPFYSGSDLKNLCVAAALACVREENEATAAGATATETTAPSSFPSKRTLKKSHFDKGLEEIGASVSEDMSSLAAIRKFDEKYGDRRSRRKGKGMGFGVLSGKDMIERDREMERLREREGEEERVGNA